MGAHLLEEQGKNNIQGILDGSGTIPISCPCFKLLKPSFDEVNQRCSTDILPIPREEASLADRLNCSFHSSHRQDVYSISVLSGEGNSPQCAPELAFSSFSEVANTSKTHTCLDEQLNCHNCIDLKTENAEVIPPCVVDINIEMGYSKIPESTDEAVEGLKSKGLLAHLQKVLWRQASLKIGGKLTQLLTYYSTSRDKSMSERAHDNPNNRWRRYKRSASFDSRKIFDSRTIVLLFSILSSLGTLVLIYLTLRVRQSADSYVHV